MLAFPAVSVVIEIFLLRKFCPADAAPRAHRVIVVRSRNLAVRARAWGSGFLPRGLVLGITRQSASYRRCDCGCWDRARVHRTISCAVRSIASGGCCSHECEGVCVCGRVCEWGGRQASGGCAGVCTGVSSRQTGDAVVPVRLVMLLLLLLLSCIRLILRHP